MAEPKPNSEKSYQTIPGTYVFDGQACKDGFHLNMFCKSLDKQENRDRFRADPAPYLNQFPMAPEQRKAIEDRDWLAMLQLGGNIYYTFKLCIFDGMTMQGVGGKMSGVTEEEFRNMMIEGGRSIEGNRYKAEV